MQTEPPKLYWQKGSGHGIDENIEKALVRDLYEDNRIPD